MQSCHLLVAVLHYQARRMGFLKTQSSLYQQLLTLGPCWLVWRPFCVFRTLMWMGLLALMLSEAIYVLK